MRQDWIFDMLADLRSFAEMNDLPAVAAQVDITIAVARAEMDGRDRMRPPPVEEPHKPH